MSSWGNMMKRLSDSNVYRLAGLIGALTFIVLASGSFAQVDRAELSRSLDRDLLPVAMPLEMEVTDLNLDSGIVYLEDEGYSLALFTESAGALEAPLLQAGFDLESLMVGEWVIVETDGTAPSDTHTPYITAIRRP